MSGQSEFGFGAAFIDIDEWRDRPRQHRYVHGGFDNTHTLFSFYFPPAELYRGRFFQYLEGGAGGHENLIAADFQVGLKVDWILDLLFDELGGFAVESNQGHFPGEGTGFSNDVELFGASAESALYARQLAEEMYGAPPHHGYVWGVSGGGGRSAHCLESRPDVWQGGAPHAGVHMSTQWSAWALAWIVARASFPGIIDAMEPGGSGDPFAGLSHAEREAVADLYRRGYPRGAENQLAPFLAWAFRMVRMEDEDPSYFDDFWHTPGYLGADNPQSLASLVINERTTVKRVVPASKLSDVFAQMYVRLATAGAHGSDPAWGVSVNLDVDDPDLLLMSKVKILSGKAAGRELLITGVEDGVISPFSERTPDVFEEVEPGDEVEIDNRDFIAFCYYHRYAIEDMIPGDERIAPELKPWTVDGHPIYPQRQTPAGRPLQTGRISNKMIYVQPTLDNMVWPNSISSYHRLIQKHLGEKVDSQFRLWWVENACHAAPDLIGPQQTTEKDPNVWLSRLVSYDGVTAQALRDLVDWVEKGVGPPSYTGYQLTYDNALVLPATAAERGGVQPVVMARVNGALRTHVKVGEAVSFEGTAEQPPGNGAIVGAEWDFEGCGAWEPASSDIDGTSSSVTLTATHSFTEPRTYFPSFRVSAHRDGAKGQGVPVQNLARVRVVVDP